MSAKQEPVPSPHLDDAQCADLVLGLVPMPLREEWLDHAAACTVCEARFKSHVSATARAHDDWRSRVATSVIVPHPALRRGTPIMALAAAAVLAVAVALPLLQPTSLVPISTAWLPSLGEAVRTREGDVEDPRLTRGMAAYDAHDLVTADRELSAAQARGASESMRRLYLAHVRLALGGGHESLELLHSLDWRSIPEPYRREGAELLVRALRATGETTAADSIEKKLRTIPRGTPFLP